MDRRFCIATQYRYSQPGVIPAFHNQLQWDIDRAMAARLLCNFARFFL
jgi:hypothetical protein